MLRMFLSTTYRVIAGQDVSIIKARCFPIGTGMVGLVVSLLHKARCSYHLAHSVVGIWRGFQVFTSKATPHAY